MEFYATKMCDYDFLKIRPKSTLSNIHVFIRFNNIFTLLNLSVVIFVIAAGSSKASFDNWRIGETSAALKGTVGETEEEPDVDENINIGMTCALYEKPVLQISRFC